VGTSKVFFWEIQTKFIKMGLKRKRERKRERVREWAIRYRKEWFTNHIDDQSISNESLHLFDRPFPVNTYLKQESDIEKEGGKRERKREGEKERGREEREERGERRERREKREGDRIKREREKRERRES
jgi:hypothetical protein